MIDDAFVIDAVVHGYNLSKENEGRGAIPGITAAMVYGFHRSMSPRSQPQYILDQHRFMHGCDPDLLAHALFAESRTDAAFYHETPVFGFFKDGGSPMWVGKEIQKRHPGRIHLYGAISPWMPNPVEQVDRLVDEDKVVGIKLYPQDLVDGELKDYRMDDPEAAFPIYERAVKRGIRTIAIHKAIPLGPVPTEPYRVNDIEGAAAAFPTLNFEIVQGGFAFLEETALQVARFPNVCINLEGTSAFLINMPRKFAEILGTFMAWGAADRIIWATGCIFLHPQPFLEAFWNLEMPAELVEGYGFPPLTPDVKRGMLGGNIARILGLDLDAMRRQFSTDEFARRQELAAPWSGTKVAV
jgi:predicted TIM-barrel fold metal-dependent hydrolase